MSLSKEILKISELKSIMRSMKEENSPEWQKLKEMLENHVDREDHAKRTKRDEGCGCDKGGEEDDKQ